MWQSGVKLMHRSLLFLIITLWAFGFKAYGQDVLPVTLSHPMVRPGKIGQNTAAFVVIQNHSHQDLKLIKALTPIAGKVELHRSFAEDGIQKMRRVDNIPINAGEKAVLESGGLHIMLFNLKSNLEDNPDKPQEVPITLLFDSGEKLETLFLVEKGGFSCH